MHLHSQPAQGGLQRQGHNSSRHSQSVSILSHQPEGLTHVVQLAACCCQIQPHWPLWEETGGGYVVLLLQLLLLLPAD